MYEAYSDYESMMNMAEEIVTQCALAVCGKLTIDYQVMNFYFPLQSIQIHQIAFNGHKLLTHLTSS